MPNTAANPDKQVHVAVAVIRNTKGEILLTRRHPEAHQGGFWEFPGGKVEVGESLEEALVREIFEELSLKVIAHRGLLQVEHDYGDKRVLLDVCEVTDFIGEPQACENQPMRWVAVQELANYAFPKANEAIVDALLKA